MRRVSLVVVLTGFVILCSSAGLAGLSESLPLCRDWAGDSELPLPLGAGFVVHYQEQGYQLDSLGLTLAPGAPPVDLQALLATADLSIDSELLEVHFALDAWVLPFLNVYALLGYIDGETVVDVAVPPTGLELLIAYSGLVYGAGATLAGGWENFFATVTGTITETDLDVSTSSVSAWVVSPRAGVNTRVGSFWLGAMYQEAEEDHEGNVTVDVLGAALPVVYDARLKQDEPWNYLAGFSTMLFDSLEVNIEGGVGDRKQITATTKLRF